MTVDPSSYGTSAGVASFTPRYANTESPRDFDTGTKPTLAEVEGWVDEVSGILNIILSDNRFSIPVSQASAKKALNLFVHQEVAALVEGSHNAGRFGPSAKNPRSGRFDLIFRDVEEFVKRMAGGLEAMGASRGNVQTNVGTKALTRADGYSDDLNATEASQL